MAGSRVVPPSSIQETPPRAARPVAAARILAVKFADIGDALGIEPALAALRAAYPTATIDALVTPGARAALATCPHLNEIIDFNKYLYDSPRSLVQPDRLLSAARFVADLRRRRYDTVILFHHLATGWGALKFGLVSRLTGAAVVAGLDNGRGRFLTHAALDRGFGAVPEWRYWLRVVASLGIPAPEQAPTFVIPLVARAEAAALLAPLAGRRPLIALHAGVGGYAPLKQWPVERFASVAQRLIADHGATILLVGGPEMKLLGAGLVRAIGAGAVDLTGRTSLASLAALLAECDLLVGNESGVAHLAAAVGCRTLALFGPTNIDAWAPYGAQAVTLPRGGGLTDLGDLAGRRAIALRVDEPCSPCYYTGFAVHERGQCSHRNCLHHLTPPMVATAAGQLLAARPVAWGDGPVDRSPDGGEVKP